MEFAVDIFHLQFLQFFVKAFPLVADTGHLAFFSNERAVAFFKDFVDDLLLAEPKSPMRYNQPRRILHGDKIHGCTGWNGMTEIEYPIDFA